MNAENLKRIIDQISRDKGIDRKLLVEAIEEAVINAMISAEAMTTVKPAGYTLEAIDHERLKEIMRQHNRLEK